MEWGAFEIQSFLLSWSFLSFLNNELSYLMNNNKIKVFSIFTDSGTDGEIPLMHEIIVTFPKVQI